MRDDNHAMTPPLKVARRAANDIRVAVFHAPVEDDFFACHGESVSRGMWHCCDELSTEHSR